ncbi:MAG: ABC transporter permease [Lachnospiraceae bacterium]|nr:ABC transporter permease [Lachnospiraceae bacterium]
MLVKKMLRDITKNIGQFISVLLLSALALVTFSAFKSEASGGLRRMDNLSDKYNRADGWIYGEGFTKEDLDAVKNLPKVKDAQLRTMLSGETIEFEQAQVILYLEDENVVSLPYLVEGEEFNPADKESVWINKQFAKEWDIELGDTISVNVMGVKIDKKVAGFIYSLEHIYIKADKDMDTDFKNIVYMYMSSKAIDELADMKPTQLIFTTDEKSVKKLEEDISKALNGNYSVLVDADSISGIKNYVSEMEQHNAFSYVFAGIFVVVSIFIIMTTMRRIIEAQRTQIGTMSALGVKPWKIAFHYASYSFVPSLVGSFVGIYLGMFAIRKLMYILTNYYTLPGWKPEFLPEFYLCALVVVIACMLSSYFSCKRLLRIEPAAALRPAPPKAGKNTIFEKLPFWSKLSFTSTYNLRDISRSKLRTAMCLIGLFFGTAFALSAFFCSTTMDKMKDWSMDKVSAYNYQIAFQGNVDIDTADKLADEYNGELIMGAQIEIAKTKNQASDKRDACNLVVTEGKGLYGLTDVDINEVSIKPGTVALTRKLAKKYGLEVGDTVYWHVYGENTWYESEIGLINRNFNTQGITILRADFEKLENVTYKPAQLITNDDVDKNKLLDNEFITSVYSKEEMIENFDKAWEAMDALTAVFAIFAVMFIVIVLYNAGNLSFNERKRELATLRVLGLSDSRIANLLTVQNLWLTIVGIVVGTPIGKAMITAMMDTNGEQYDYAIFTKPMDYIKSYLLVFITSVVTSLLFTGRIKKLDMVSQLKANE